MDTAARIELFWLPLGAGGRSVRLNGIAFEALCARLEHRPRYDLYHSALAVHVPDGRYIIEMTPIRAIDSPDRLAVAGGAVGSRRLGRFSIFRYEVIRWRGGVIPDVAEAVDSPRVISTDIETARRLLGLVPRLPAPVWGRDELGTGEMWNSNSIVSWLLTRSGVEADSIKPPAGGRAPGWRAGLVVAHNRAQTSNAGAERDVFASAKPSTANQVCAHKPTTAARTLQLERRSAERRAGTPCQTRILIHSGVRHSDQSRARPGVGDEFSFCARSDSKSQR
jgi:hypothetical protein